MTDRAKTFTPNTARLGIVTLVLVLLLALVGLKLAKVQIFDWRLFAGENDNESLRKVAIKPIRGEILDRNTVPIVSNTLYYDIWCEPVNIRNKGGAPRPDGTFVSLKGEKTTEGVANILSKELGIRIEDVLESLDGESAFSFIQRKVDPVMAERVSRHKLKGVYITDLHGRYYPQGELSLNLLGWTDIDEKGLTGIEGNYNSFLSGSPGVRTYPKESDSQGTDRYIIEKPATHGDWLILTIDSTMQFIAKQRMNEALAHWNADAAICVIQDPATGEILAAADSMRKGMESFFPYNMPMTYRFEPGSVFKGIIAAIGIDCKAIGEKTVLSDNGGITCADQTFRCDWLPNPYKGHGSQNLVQAIRNSCNVVFVQYGQKILQAIGKRFYNKLLEFGFGSNPGSGIEESAGAVQKPEQWHGTSPWNMFFGRGITVTPLQLTNAYSAIANGGVLMRPKLVAKRYNPNTGETTIIENEVLRKVVSPQSAARTMLALSQNVIWQNTDTVYKAAIKGYGIAGKTGTANQIHPKDGYYDNHRTGIRYNCSFIGIIPSDDAVQKKLTILVTVVNPKNTYDNAALVGSNVAAPYFRLVAEDVTSLLHIGPKDEIKGTSKKSPN